MADRKRKRPMVGGPERHKACGMCDGPPDKRFRTYWRTFRRIGRAPQPGDWDDRTIEDGFGSRWIKCLLPDCSLQVVRPGKVQCNDERVLTEFGWEWVPPCVWEDRRG